MYSTCTCISGIEPHSSVVNRPTRSTLNLHELGVHLSPPAVKMHLVSNVQSPIVPKMLEIHVHVLFCVIMCNVCVWYTCLHKLTFEAKFKKKVQCWSVDKNASTGTLYMSKAYYNLKQDTLNNPLVKACTCTCKSWEKCEKPCIFWQKNTIKNRSTSGRIIWQDDSFTKFTSS